MSDFSDLVTCFVINLDTRPDRWKRMKRVCARRGIVPVRFSAHDRDTGKATFPESPLEPAELGIWSSFASVVQSDVDTEWILVLEDDAILLPGFRRQVERYASEASPDVITIRLGWFVRFTYRREVGPIRYVYGMAKWLVLNAGAVLRGGWRSRRSLGVNRRLGAHAVLIRARSVPAMLSTFGPAEIPIDSALIRAESAAPDVYTLSRRNLAWQWPSRSDIAPDRIDKAIRLRARRG